MSASIAPGAPPGWPSAVRARAEALRPTAGRYPYDRRLSALVTELRACSTEFAAL